jgi:hypothetical protein
MKRIASLCCLLAFMILPSGCAITDYSPWPGHKTQGDAKLWGAETSFAGIHPKLDGTYAYSVSYDHSNIPIGAFPRITITSWHNNGFTFQADGTLLPPAFNPDGFVDRPGDLTGKFGTYFVLPPWTRDQKWGKFFIAVDTDGDCQFFNNITQDFSGSPSGPMQALCLNLPREEIGEIVELEDFASLDDLFGRIWDGTLGNAFTMNVTAISFNGGGGYQMINPLSVAMKSNGLRPSTFAVDFSTAAGKELLQSILNNTVDQAPNTISLSFSGGLKFNLPAAYQIAFNHAVIRTALGQ